MNGLPRDRAESPDPARNDADVAEVLRRALAEGLSEELPRRLMEAVLEQANCPRDLRVNALGKSQRHGLGNRF